MLRTCTRVWFKAIASGFFIAIEFLFDSLQKQAMIAIIVLITIDFISGLYASLKSGQKIQSSKIRRTAFKVAAYFLLISAGFVAEKAVPIQIIDDTIISFLAATELISILENMSLAGYAIPIKLLDSLKNLISKK